MKIRTPYNRNLYPSVGQVFYKPSLTIPDQTLSLTQILDRYAKGLSIPSSTSSVYDEDGGGNIPDFRRMDLTDQHEYIQKIGEELSEKVKIDKDAKAKKAGDDEFNRRLEEWKKSQSPVSEPAPTR